MQATKSNYNKIIKGATQFIIPVFQRDYSWTDAQCDQLWSDVLAVAKGKPDHCHFLGSVVYVSTSDSSAGFTRWLLIDGQQRVTTLTLLNALGAAQMLIGGINRYYTHCIGIVTSVIPIL